MPEANRTLEEFISQIEAGQEVAAGFIPGSAPSWLIGFIQRSINRPVLVVVSDEEKAGQTAKELALFCPNSPLIFPAIDYCQPEGTEPSGERMSAAAGIFKREARLVVTSAAALFQPTLPPDLLNEFLFDLKPKAIIDRDDFLKRMLQAGYSMAASVSEPGEISVRGGIVDIFPPGSESPARIEFFGNEIDSIRLFDPANQRSRGQADRYLVWPAREMVLTETSGKELRQALYKLAEDLKKDQPGEENISFARALQEIVIHLDSQDHFYAEERYLPLLQQKCSLLDYLDQEWLVISLDEMAINQSLAMISQKAQNDWSRLVAGGSLLPRPQEVFFSPDKINKKISEFQSAALGLALKGAKPEPQNEFSLEIQVERSEELHMTIELNPDLAFSPKLSEPISKFLEEIKKHLAEKFSVILVSPSLSQAEKLSGILREHEIFPGELGTKAEFYEPVWPLAIAVGELQTGFKVQELGLVIISEQEIFGEKIRRPLVRQEQTEWRSEDLSDLEPGELIVHILHGIGIYRGMSQVKVSSFEQWDYLKDRSRPSVSQPVLEIEYADGARLYLPVDQINLVQKYRNPGDAHPKLDRLGTQSFELAKKHAEEAIELLAHDLLDLYASREVFPGYNYLPPDHAYREFEASFDYEETEDQEKAIADVVADLSKPRPMDRVVLGDVGYGKTEVALRASFVAAMQGKQVAMLCPTTILAQQHFDNFQRRLKDWPLEVCMLSRFESRAEQKKIIENLGAGLCDVAIGTHRLLSKDVQFRDLGLLIVDEEQRFGVVQKEKIKQLKKVVDCLTLSATPIPRTMQMTMLGLRDLSIINTPPPDRQAIHTELIHFDQQLIREAVLREIQRKGQVFFVHNRVQGIDAIARWLAKLVPEAKIAVAHGQMEAAQAGENHARILPA